MSNNNTRILSQPISYQELKSLGYNISIPGVYKIENNINHKVYIGQSKNVIKRFREHIKCGKIEGKCVFREENEHLRSSFEKYGLNNFSFEILVETYDLNYWEKFLIQIYHATDRRYGYNITDGGTYGGYNDEWRRRISKGVINVLNSSRGDEIKQKISKSKQGKPAKNKGSKWYNNGEKNIMAFEQPKGFTSGIINKNCLSKEEKQFRLKQIKQKEYEADILMRQREENKKQEYNSKSCHWYNNGIQSIRAKECPEGFVPGRLGDFSQSKEANQKRSDWYNNLTDEQRHIHNKKAADARKGKPKSNTCKSNISKANKGRKYYNNGIIEMMQFKQPEGFVPGRLPSIKKKISEESKKRRNSNINNKE